MCLCLFEESLYGKIKTFMNLLQSFSTAGKCGLPQKLFSSDNYTDMITKFKIFLRCHHLVFCAARVGRAASLRQEAGSNQTRLSVGCFTVFPGFGTILPGGVQNVTVDCVSESIEKTEEVNMKYSIALKGDLRVYVGIFSQNQFRGCGFAFFPPCQKKQSA